MIEKGYVHPIGSPKGTPNKWWTNKTVSELPLQTPCTITPEVSCKEAVEILKKNGFNTLPVVDTETNAIVGVISEGNLTANLMPGRVDPSDPIAKVVYKQFKRISVRTSLGELSQIFDKDHFALVVSDQRCFAPGGKEESKVVVFGVVTRIDLLSFITNGNMSA